MSSRRPDRRDDEEDRGRYRRDDRDEDRDRRARRYDEDDRDRRDRRYDDDRDRRDDDYDEPRRRPSRRDEDDDDDYDRPRRRRKGRKSKTGIIVLIVLLFGLPLLGLGGFLIYHFVSSSSKARERLVGRWEGQVKAVMVTLEFNDDKTASISISGTSIQLRLKWSVKRSSKDTLVLTMHNPPTGVRGERMRPTEEWTITFLSDNEIRIQEDSGNFGEHTFKRKVQFPAPRR